MLINSHYVQQDQTEKITKREGNGHTNAIVFCTKKTRRMAGLIRLIGLLQSFECSLQLGSIIAKLQGFAYSVLRGLDLVALGLVRFAGFELQGLG